MMNLRMLGLMVRDGVTGAKLLDVFKRLESDYKKLGKLASSRKPKFFVDESVDENPYMYQAGGMRVDFHYYDFIVPDFGNMRCILKNADKVTVGVLTGEACDVFYNMVQES